DYYKNNQQYEKIKKSYYRALKNKDNSTLYCLETNFGDRTDFQNLKINYLLFPKEEPLYILGVHFGKMENYQKMEKYFLNAVEYDNSDAMCGLGMYYSNLDCNKMIKYFLMAINEGSSRAMHNLGYYFDL